MGENETDLRREEERPELDDNQRPSVEDGGRPVPGVKHEPEPDAENIMPAQDGPGTF
jgi:hypothetical protein